MLKSWLPNSALQLWQLQWNAKHILLIYFQCLLVLFFGRCSFGAIRFAFSLHKLLCTLYTQRFNILYSILDATYIMVVRTVIRVFRLWLNSFSVGCATFCSFSLNAIKEHGALEILTCNYLSIKFSLVNYLIYILHHDAPILKAMNAVFHSTSPNSSWNFQRNFLSQHLDANDTEVWREREREITRIKTKTKRPMEW